MGLVKVSVDFSKRSIYYRMNICKLKQDVILLR